MATEPLVSASATPPLVPSLESEGLGGEQIGAFTFPTPQQHAAIIELKTFSEDKVFAWLAFVRSLEYGYRYRSCAGGLSCQQVNAISTLKDCSDSNISIWFQYAALSGNVNLRPGVSRSTSKSSASPSPRHTQRPSSKFTFRSSTSSFAPSIHSTNTTLSTPRSSTGYASSLPDLPEAASENDILGHTHWCPECGKSIHSCDGWKRHMKEHETYYPCMPAGPVEHHQDIPTCAFCGLPYPNRDHLAGHHVSLCTSGSKTPTRKSRKSLMVTHLALHGVLDAAASDLADKWQCKRNKRAFSCGFCINHFATIMEQLNHIDNEHYKHGQVTSSWDINIVIKGLLHQPKVYKYWLRLLMSNPALSEAKFRWDSLPAETLQTQLEMGDESGSDLALIAFGAAYCDSELVRSNISTAITVPILQHMAVDPFANANGLQMDSGQGVPELFSHQTSAAKGQKPLLAARFLPETPSWSDSNDISEAPHPSKPSNPLDQPMGYQGSFASDDLGVQFSSHQALAFEHHPNLNDNKPSLYVLPSEYQSLESGQHFDQLGRVQDCSKENSDFIVNQLSYPYYRTVPLVPNTSANDVPSNQRPMDLATFSNEAILSPRLLDLGSKSQDSKSISYEKPLPALPMVNEKSERQGPESRPLSPPRPMDLDTS